MKSFFIYLLLRFYRLLIKIKIEHDFDIEHYPSSLIFAFWHEIILFLPFAAPKKRDISILISTHKDGRLASDVIRYFGLGNIGGSSNREPTKAFLEMLKFIKDGKDIGITPDGPKGPRRKLKKGVVELAYLSNSPVVVVVCEVSKKWRINSWDKMIIPKPFSTVTFRFLNPIFVKDKKEFKEKSELIENKLNEY